MAKRKNKGILIKVLLHTLMTVLTGGLWLLGLVIWWMIKK